MDKNIELQRMTEDKDIEMLQRMTEHFLKTLKEKHDDKC